MAIADANIILRYVLNDHEELSARAEEIIENNVVTLPIEVACEIVFVLQKVYQVERSEIKAILESRKNKRSLLNPKIHSLSRDKRTEKPGG